MKWELGKGSSLFLKLSGFTGPTGYGNEPGCNGLIFDGKGQLVSAEHGDRRLSVLTHQGGKRTLVDNYEGKRLNSPNDVCMKSNGDYYFTDPPYGLPKGAEDPLRELDFCGVYQLALQADGRHQLTLLTKEMTRPNGIAFSPDEKFLYVAQSDPKAAIIKNFPLRRTARLGKGRHWSMSPVWSGSTKAYPMVSKSMSRVGCGQQALAVCMSIPPQENFWEELILKKPQRTVPGATMVRRCILRQICTCAGFQPRPREQAGNGHSSNCC